MALRNQLRRGEARFAGVFVAVVLGTGMVLAALLLNRQRPDVGLAQPTEALVRATGKCAECHRRETSAMVHQFETSEHAAAGVNCLDCHSPQAGQESMDHRGFVIAEHLTAKNCSQCHATEYEQFLRSRHAAPAWAAVRGAEDFTLEQVTFAEDYHPGAVDRPPNELATLEGDPAITTGCAACHNVGKPNPDGSIGTCTACHARHSSSIELARNPQTCGQCHMGPDHAQIEIYNESKHGVLFHAQKHRFNLDADPKQLTTADMPVPTCSTCHMSGLEGQQVSHDTSNRLGWYLFAAVSDERPNHTRNVDQMQDTCMKCHSQTHVDQFYEEAEAVLVDTNEKVNEVKQIVDQLYEEDLLTPAPFDEPIEYAFFDYWHYYGRTAKHGAFMGGADFVQWHGNYELLKMKIEIEEMAREIRAHAEERTEGANNAEGADNE